MTTYSRHKSLWLLGAAMATAAWLPAGAQTLEKEITIEHEIVPEQREALKMPLTPTVDLPPVTMRKLDIISRGIPAAPSPMAALLAPQTSPLLLPDTTGRGYVALGYFPVYNLGASAGYDYRSGSMRSGVWMQFDGHRYGRTVPLADEKRHFRRNTLTTGADAAVATSNGTLHADLAWTGDWYNAPVLSQDMTEVEMHSQSASDFKLGFGFDSPRRTSGLTWNVGLNLGFFSFGRDGHLPGIDAPAAMAPVRESHVRLGGGVSGHTSETSEAGLDLIFDYLRDNRRSTLYLDTDPQSSHFGLSDSETSHSMGLFTARPHWKSTRRHLTTDIGALMQLTFNSGKAFHIAPDVLVAWTPDSHIAIYGRAGGGEYLNLLSGLHQTDYTIAPMVAYDMSHLPLTLEGGIKAEPWRGFSARAYVRCAVANHWLMPVDAPGSPIFMPVDMRGWLLGAELTMIDSHTWSALLRYECSPGRAFDRGWYLWRDRARQALEAMVGVRPVSQLQVSASLTLREGRHTLYEYSRIALDHITDIHQSRSLGTVADLSLSGSWSFTSELSAFVQLNNLMGRNWDTGYTPSQGFHGFLGATYKF